MQVERAKPRKIMKLGEVIERLKKEVQHKKLNHGFDRAHSYRGDYHQLAVEPTYFQDVENMLNVFTWALNEHQEGWKGGCFHMHRDVDVYIANQGNTGIPLYPELLESILADEYSWK